MEVFRLEEDANLGAPLSANLPGMAARTVSAPGLVAFARPLSGLARVENCSRPTAVKCSPLGPVAAALRASSLARAILPMGESCGR
jgi:hypothetical protein